MRQCLCLRKLRLAATEGVLALLTLRYFGGESLVCRSSSDARWSIYARR